MTTDLLQGDCLEVLKNDGRFKKGQHWRPHKPYWDREWLDTEYTEKGRSAADIASEFGITEGAILFWMHKHGIQARPMTEIRTRKH